MLFRSCLVRTKSVISSAMAKKEPPASEGEALAALLSELESVREVKEIAGWETGFPRLSAALNGLLPGLTLRIGPPAER